MKAVIILLLAVSLQAQEIVEPSRPPDSTYMVQQSREDKRTVLKVFGSIVIMIFLVGFWVEDGRK